MKPACLPPDINPTCIDPTPDGVTCFSYSHCLNVRSGNYYNNADPCDPKNTITTCHADDRGGTDIGLPHVGSSHVEVLLPILCMGVVTGLWLILKRLRGVE